MGFFALFCTFNSLAQKDSSFLYAYKQVLGGTFKKVDIDTLLDNAHYFNPIIHGSFSATYLGNLGLPALNNYLINRPDWGAYVLNQGLDYYRSSPEKIAYYNTNIPFTYVTYVSGGKKSTNEQTIKLIHSQNVNTKLNFGIDLANYTSIGQYKGQEARNINFNLFGRYNGDRYQANGYFSYLTITNQENGGLQSDSLLRNLDDKTFAAEGLEVNLNDARSKYREVGLYYNHRLGFDIFHSDNTFEDYPHWIGHSVTLKNYKRKYKDNESTAGFYRHFYNSLSGTDDSISLNVLENRITLQSAFFRKVGMPLAQVFYGNELQLWQMNMPYDTLVIYQNQQNDTSIVNQRKHFLFNNYLGFAAGHSTFDVFQWNVSYKQLIAGYNSGDFLVEGTLVLNPYQMRQLPAIKGGLSQSRNTPSWVLSHYSSNHYRWENGLSPYFKFRLYGELLYDSIRFNAGVAYDRIQNMVYITSEGQPTNAQGEVNILSIWAKKRFDFWKLHSGNEILWQMVPDNVAVDVPELSVKHSLWFEHLFNFKVSGGKMLFQLGYDVRYNSAWYLDGYLPSAGVFYSQRDTRTGEYVYVDVFTKIRVKRIQIFVRVDHVNSGWIKRNYFTAYHYPMQGRMFKFGLNWAFSE